MFPPQPGGETLGARNTKALLMARHSVSEPAEDRVTGMGPVVNGVAVVAVDGAALVGRKGQGCE